MIRPMLAKAGELPVGAGWLYEVKWDGFRCTAVVEDGRVTMQSRSAKSNYVQRFPEVAAALATLPDCVIDGELVTMDGNGDTFGIDPDGIGTLIVFDVLEMWGSDVRQMPLDDRRRVLTEVLALALNEQPRLAISPAFDNGEQLLAWASGRGIEGIVAKRRNSRYRDGSRAGEWVKVKVRREQEFVVCGYVPGKNGRTGHIGGLVLGYYVDGQLVYAGRSGNKAAYDRELETRLVPADCPFQAVPREEREAVWVVPELVVQVAYQRWTDDGRLVHPSTTRIRDDKDAVDVTREG